MVGYSCDSARSGWRSSASGLFSSKAICAFVVHVDLHRRARDAGAVDGDVAVNDELSGLLSRGREPLSVGDRLETALEQVGHVQ